MKTRGCGNKSWAGYRCGDIDGEVCPACDPVKALDSVVGLEPGDRIKDRGTGEAFTVVSKRYSPHTETMCVHLVDDAGGRFVIDNETPAEWYLRLPGKAVR